MSAAAGLVADVILGLLKADKAVTALGDTGWTFSFLVNTFASTWRGDAFPRAIGTAMVGWCANEEDGTAAAMTMGEGTEDGVRTAWTGVAAVTTDAGVTMAVAVATLLLTADGGSRGEGDVMGSYLIVGNGTKLGDPLLFEWT